jgi:hypothetical protein
MPGEFALAPTPRHADTIHVPDAYAAIQQALFATYDGDD